MKRNLFFVIISLSVTKICCKKDANNKTIVENIRQSLAITALLPTLNSSSNTVVSVFSLQLQLCKLASIANGEAKTELMKALGFKKEETIYHYYSYFGEAMRGGQMMDLTYVNRLYVDSNKPISPSFIANSTSMFGVQVDKTGFSNPRSAMSFINNGISAALYRRVQKVLEPNDVDNLTSILLITAAHIKVTWLKRFNHERTTSRSFRLLNNSRIDVPMMSKVQMYKYYNIKDFQVLRIPLAWGATMTFYRPDYLSLSRILEKLKDVDFNRQIISNLKEIPIRVVVPKIKIRSTVTLNEYLEKLGITEILSKNTTGLNGILNKVVNGSNMFVSKVKQKLFLDADEYGVARQLRGGAAFDDEWEEGPRQLPANLLEIVLDRPFYFTIDIIDLTQPGSNVSTALFSGIYYQPEE